MARFAHTFVRWLFPMSLLAAMTGCPDGGSSGGDGGTIVIGNRAPVFTSALADSVVEQTSGTFYTATATDADGDPITFSINGGADAGFFAITPAGALAFQSPPDFEQPGDGDSNNVYDLVLAASDGRATVTHALAVTVTDAENTAYRVRRVVSGIAAPVFVAPVPDSSGRLFVGELAGRIRILDPANGTIDTQDFLDLRGTLSTNGERGLLGFATAPDFATSGLFYVFVTDLVGTIEVRRYGVSATDRDVADESTMRLVLRQPHPRTNHNGGWLGFDNGDLLYVAIGDGGGSGDPDNNGQDTDTLLGKLLRIDPRTDGFPGDPMRNYAIPPDNPFRVAGGAPEVWAWGLRNPFRASVYFGPGGTGFGTAILLGDVGEDTVEEIDYVLAEGESGVNFGWSIREGTRAFKGPDNPAFRAPVAEYLHGAGPRSGDTVIGGLVYTGPIEALQGEYFFADFIQPNVWSIPISRLLQSPPATVPAAGFTLRNADLAPEAGAFTNVVAFGEDQSHNLYIVDMDGEIFVVEPAPSQQPAPSVRQARGQRAVAPLRHFCIEAWDGHTVRWRDGEMILGGEGIACVRKYYEALARARNAGAE